MTAQDIGLYGLTARVTRLRSSVETDSYNTKLKPLAARMRALTYAMPPRSTLFAVTLIENGIPVTEVTLARADIEELEFELDGAWASYTRAIIEDGRSVAVEPGLFPRFDWGLEPYVAYSLFDPDAPFANWGSEWTCVVTGSLRPASFSPAQSASKSSGIIDDATRPSTSTLPRVRSESNIYDQQTPRSRASQVRGTSDLATISSGA